ncbi:MAG: minor capsid protein, partial [Lachnospiraceae bacterium]|nr:minor capsid protein [Lachnospiraceae bacterium]
MASDHILPPTGVLRDDYDVKRAFARIEHELLASMMRNLGRHLKEEQDEGFDWSQWQVEQLKNLEEYRRRNRKEYGPRFKEINVKMEEAIRFAHENGQKDEELNILSAISQDRKIQPRYANPSQPSIEAGGDAFFRVNDDKLEALVEAAHSDMEKAEQAVLRRTNDQYRKIIFDAQVYANTGAGTVEKAVDMATKDFLAKGIDSIQYKNGARHTISDYADMYIRTAEKRAYLMGEGKKRQEWGESLVIVNRRGTMKNGNYGTACPQCIPWLGKILIDDVYS